MQNKYIVNNERQKNYLYCLGFDYTVMEDRKNPKKLIFLFERTDNLLKAVDFYCHMRYALRTGGEFNE